jgi:hypothetical protein
VRIVAYQHEGTLAVAVKQTQVRLNVTRAEIEDLTAKYDYHPQYAVLQFTMGLLR